MSSALTKTIPRLDKHKCKGLGPCVPACPKGAIEMRGLHFWFLKWQQAVLAHAEICDGCGACVRACPVGAWTLD